MKVTGVCLSLFFFRSSYIQCTACGCYLTARFFESCVPQWWVWRSMLQTAWPQFRLVLLMSWVYFYSLFENTFLYNGDIVLVYSSQTPRNIAPKQPAIWPLHFWLLVTSSKLEEKQNKTWKTNKQIQHKPTQSPEQNNPKGWSAAEGET